MVKDHFAAFPGRLIASELHPRSLWRWGLCSAIYPPCDQACTRLLLNRRSCLASCSTAFPGAPGRSSVHQGSVWGGQGSDCLDLRYFEMASFSQDTGCVWWGLGTENLECELRCVSGHFGGAESSVWVAALPVMGISRSSLPPSACMQMVEHNLRRT